MNALMERMRQIEESRGKYENDRASVGTASEESEEDEESSDEEAIQSAITMLKKGKSREFLEEKEGKQWIRELRKAVNASNEKMVPIPMVKQLANWDFGVIMNSWFLTNKQQRA